MRIRWLLLLALLVGCVSRLERNVIFEPIYVANTGTLWLIEKDERAETSDQLAVIVCHREASPACIRVVPTDARDGRDYTSWLYTMPAEVRRLAAQAPVPGGLELRDSISAPAPAPLQAPVPVPAPIVPEKAPAALPPPPPLAPPLPRAPDNPY